MYKNNVYKIPKKNRIAFKFNFRFTHYLLYPWIFIKDFYKETKNFFHRGIYGYAKSDAWNTYSYISEILVGMLTQMRDEGVSAYPSCLLSETETLESELTKEREKELIELWRKLLTEMIIGFDAVSENKVYKDPHFDEKYEYNRNEEILGVFSEEGFKKLRKEIEIEEEKTKKAIELFSTYFYNLWD